MDDRKSKKRFFPAGVTHWMVLRSSLGYWFVAIVCIASGFGLRTPRLPAANDLLLMTAYAFLLIPYFLHRQALLEYKREISKNKETVEHMKGMGVDFPLLALILIVIIVALLLIIKFQDTESVSAEYDRQTALIRNVVKLVVAMVPFALLFWWTSSGWIRDDVRSYFKYRSLFPAMATCMNSFVYGWSNSTEIWGVLISSAFIMLLFLISRLKGVTDKFFMGTCITFVLILLVVGSFGFEVFNIVSFGFLLTLGMGVSETWRTQGMVIDGQEYAPAVVYGSPQNFYLGGTNVATSTIPFLFLLTSLHPSTREGYFPLAALFVILQVAFWFSLGLKNTSAAKIAGLAFGFGLPLIMMLSTHISINNLLKTRIDLYSRDTPEVIASISIAMIGISLFSSKYREALTKFRKGYSDFLYLFLKPRQCLHLMFSVCLCLAFLCSLSWFLIVTIFEDSQTLLLGLYRLSVFYFSAAFVLLIANLVMWGFSKTGKNC